MNATNEGVSPNGWPGGTGGKRTPQHTAYDQPVTFRNVYGCICLMTSPVSRLRKSRQVAGFTLVEVLVSIVILSFGLLGMVGLQAASLQANRDARLQSTAVVLARELADMMRGNKNVALLATGNPYLVGDLAASPLVPATAVYCLSAGTSCTSATEIAQAELTEWLAHVDSALPGARVNICRDTAPFDGSGLPQWTCTSTNATDPIVIKIGWSRSTFKSGSSSIYQANVPSVVLQVTAGSTV
ncbi:MAG: type IV pilus modification protein PilV [Variovorax sp.]